MFKFPWKIHGLRRFTSSDLLVEVEHRLLLELYSRALDKVDSDLSAIPEPQYSSTASFYHVQNLKHDREAYVDAIQWLKGLKG